MRKLKSEGLTLQERQKQKSRESILQAARTVLAEKSYTAMTIEDVLARSNVSRATFYKYFDSKFAIGRELHREFAPRLTAIYDALLTYDDPTEADWVVRLRPEQVVEVAFDGVQRSTRYPGGMALRFARVLRYRDDKPVSEIDTVQTIRQLADW